MDTLPLTKFCPKCEEVLDSSEFNKKTKSKDGLQDICRDCGSIKYSSYDRKQAKPKSILPITSKICAKCRVQKDASEFHRNRTTRDGLQSYCQECSKERHKQWLRDPNTSRALRTLIDAFKNRPCMDCGVKYPPYVMDFDHRDPKEKVFTISRYSSVERTAQEIQKCDVVCANCHRERTQRRLGER